MGVQGLTTFMETKSNSLEKYILQNTILVIDGNSVACEIYRNWYKSGKHFECFGGDYDMYGNVINDFFNLLGQCRIIPYVVFDGAYEDKKLPKIMDKRRVQLEYASRLNPTEELKKSKQLFCLFMYKTFQDIVTERDIKKVMCDFEGDIHIATIARELNCPILSSDSDFYIPFNTLDIDFQYSNLTIYPLQTCIICKIYKREIFLKSFQGLQDSSLPILATLSGNDFVNTFEIRQFLFNIVSKNFTWKNKITCILNWLKHITTEYAKTTLYNYFNREKETQIKLQKSVKNYELPDCAYYLKYLNDSNETQATPLTGKNLNVSSYNTPPRFSENFRCGKYPRTFMNMFIYKKYYHLVQIENNSGVHSHTISFNILSAIFKILTNDDKELLYVLPNFNHGEDVEPVPICDIPLPTYNEIEGLDIDIKKKHVLKILRTDPQFLDCVGSFPVSWNIFLLTIYYYMKKTPTNWRLIYSLVMCKLVLSHIDKKIGFIRSKHFLEKLELSPENQKVKFFNTRNVQSALENISRNDSIECLKSLIRYFEIDQEVVFDRNSVHSISEFQSCLLHICDLNALLDTPFANISIHESLNCTFIYNLQTKFNDDLNKYKNVLKGAPSVLQSFNLIVNKLKEAISSKKRERSEERSNIKKTRMN